MLSIKGLAPVGCEKPPTPPYKLTYSIRRKRAPKVVQLSRGGYKYRISISVSR